MAKVAASTEVAKKENNSPMSLVMPNSFIQSLETPDIVASNSFASPYVTFPSANGKQWKNLSTKIPGLKEYEPCLVYPSGEVFKLDPMRFSVHSGYQFWANENAAGEILKVKFEQDKAWKEYFDAVLIIYMKDRAELARCSFKTTKTPAIRKAFETLEDAKDDVKWAERSIAHKQTVQLNLAPHLRFFNELSLIQRVSKTSGLPYVQASSNEFPTTTQEWQLLGELFKQSNFAERMEAITQDVNYRKANLNKKV